MLQTEAMARNQGFGDNLETSLISLGYEDEWMSKCFQHGIAQFELINKFHYFGDFVECWCVYATFRRHRNVSIEA